MEIQTIINDALKEPNELDNIKLAKIAGFNDKEIEMVKLFWEPAFNQSWIYLSSEIIHDYYGYKESKYSTADFYKKMRSIYKEGIDYKEVDKNHEIVKYYEIMLVGNLSEQDKHGGSNKKYYIITGETFKKMCMRANTTKGNETCDYFIKVESLVIIMTKYLIERIKLEQQRQLQEKEKLLLESKEAYEKQQKELEEAKQKNLNLRTIIKNTQIHDYDGYLYFVTNRQYSLENHYRLGRSGKFSRRIAAYKNGRTKNDKLYYVFIFKTACVIALEHLFQHLLKPYRDEKGVDMYVLSWEILGPFAKRICEQFQTAFINPANELIQDNIMTERKTTIDNIPKEITPAEYNKFLENEETQEDEEEEEVELEEVETVEEQKEDAEEVESDEVQIKENNDEERDEEVETIEEQTKEDNDDEIDDEIEPEEESEKTIKTITNEVINRTVETIETTKTTTTQRLFKCKPCGEYKSYKFFGENSQTNKKHTRCIECRNKKNINLQINTSELTIYKCLGCLQEKDINEFEIDEERNDRCNQCIINNISVQKIETKNEIMYKKCKCDHKYPINQFYIKSNEEISSICLKCMERRKNTLIYYVIAGLDKTPRNYKSELLQIIKSYVSTLTLHDIFGKREIKELGNYRRCSGRHLHEIDRWQLIDEFALSINGRGNQCRTNTCTKCRRS